MPVISIISLVLCIFFHGSAVRADPLIAGQELSATKDQGGLVRCFQRTDGDHDGILLLWQNKEIYERVIKSIKLSSIISGGVSNSFVQNCGQWEKLSEQINFESPALVPVTFNTLKAVYPDFSFSDENIESIKQAQRGASVFHPEQDARTFLKNHPIADFNRQINRDLSKKYGVGFVGEIYSEYVSAQMPNQEFKNQVDQAIQTVQASPSIGLDQSSFANTKILLVSGLMQAPDNDRLGPLAKDLASVGLDAEMTHSDPVGSITANVARLTQNFLEVLNRGKNLILIAGSKGVPEMLGAVAAVSARPTPGKILAVVNLSGTFEGSFLIDWGFKFPQSIFVKKTLKAEAEKKGLVLKSFEAFENIGTQYLSKYSPTLAPSLPRQIKYFCILGVPIENGLVRDPSITGLQNQVSRTRISNQGANDGYIEFPGTDLPATWGLESHTLVLNGSHVILDGFYGPLDLMKDNDRKIFVVSIFKVIAEQYLSHPQPSNL